MESYVNHREVISRNEFVSCTAFQIVEDLPGDTFPIKDGSSKILKITPKGEITVVNIDFSDILGLAFDSQGRLYELENTTGNPFPTPGSGMILRIDGKHNYTVIASGLTLPTAMTFGPDGNLYVSNVGFGPPPVGAGQILKVVVPAN